MTSNYPLSVIVEQMRQELLAEAQRHVAAMDPMPARVQSLDRAEVFDPERPLPASKAPAVRPAVESLPPARLLLPAAVAAAPRQRRGSGP